MNLNNAVLSATFALGGYVRISVSDQARAAARLTSRDYASDDVVAIRLCDAFAAEVQAIRDEPPEGDQKEADLPAPGTCVRKSFVLTLLVILEAIHARSAHIVFFDSDALTDAELQGTNSKVSIGDAIEILCWAKTEAEPKCFTNRVHDLIHGKTLPAIRNSLSHFDLGDSDDHAKITPLAFGVALGLLKQEPWNLELPKFMLDLGRRYMDSLPGIVEATGRAWGRKSIAFPYAFALFLEKCGHIEESIVCLKTAINHGLETKAAKGYPGLLAKFLKTHPGVSTVH